MTKPVTGTETQMGKQQSNKGTKSKGGSLTAKHAKYAKGKKRIKQKGTKARKKRQDGLPAPLAFGVSEKR
jgi:hypothetical protein